MIYKNIRNNKIYLVSEMDDITKNINITKTSQIDKKFVIMGLYDGSVFFSKTLNNYRRISGDFHLDGDGHKISVSKDINQVLTTPYVGRDAVSGCYIYKVDKDTPVIFIKNMILFKFNGDTKMVLKSRIILVDRKKIKRHFEPDYYIKKYCKIPKSLKISN
jgi:hypothetical protein